MERKVRAACSWRQAEIMDHQHMHRPFAAPHFTVHSPLPAQNAQFSSASEQGSAGGSTLGGLGTAGGELGEGTDGPSSAACNCWVVGPRLHSPLDLSHMLPAEHPVATHPCKDRPTA